MRNGRSPIITPLVPRGYECAFIVHACLQSIAGLFSLFYALMNRFVTSYKVIFQSSLTTSDTLFINRALLLFYCKNPPVSSFILSFHALMNGFVFKFLFFAMLWQREPVLTCAKRFQTQILLLVTSTRLLRPGRLSCKATLHHHQKRLQGNTGQGLLVAASDVLGFSRGFGVTIGETYQQTQSGRTRK